MPQIFTKVDRKLLVSLVNKYNYMADTKCEDVHLKKSRIKEAWRHIQNEFNLVSSQKRTMNQLQRYWAKIKKAKKCSKIALMSLQEQKQTLSITKSHDSPVHSSKPEGTPKATQVFSSHHVSDIKDRGDIFADRKISPIFADRKISPIQFQNLVINKRKSNETSTPMLLPTQSTSQFDNVVNELHDLQRKELNLNIKAAERRNRILEIDLKRAQIELNNAIEIGKRMIDISDIKMRKASKGTKSQY